MASWKQVAFEAVKHPYSSGVMDIGVGGVSVGTGVALHDPILIGCGVGLVGIGACKFRHMALTL